MEFASSPSRIPILLAKNNAHDLHVSISLATNTGLPRSHQTKTKVLFWKQSSTLPRFQPRKKYDKTVCAITFIEDDIYFNSTSPSPLFPRLFPSNRFPPEIAKDWIKTVKYITFSAIVK